MRVGRREGGRGRRVLRRIRACRASAEQSREARSRGMRRVVVAEHSERRLVPESAMRNRARALKPDSVAL